MVPVDGDRYRSAQIRAEAIVGRYTPTVYRELPVQPGHTCWHHGQGPLYADAQYRDKGQVAVRPVSWGLYTGGDPSAGPGSCYRAVPAPRLGARLNRFAR